MKPFGSAAARGVVRSLEEAGYEAVFVGGAVRDFVLGKNAHDYDIATSAKPAEVKAVFDKTVDVGIAHGTVLVLLEGEAIEVTTYRTESIYTDHRRPDNVQFDASLREDLSRRDFTMNALAVTSSGEVIDYFGGREDLQQGIIRAIGKPAERFLEDALRMVRAIRFAGVFGFDIESNTIEAIGQQKQLLPQVSAERIKSEMDKLFCGLYANKGFQYAVLSGLAEYMPLFPESLQTLYQTVPFRSSKEGWACFMESGDFSPGELARAFKLSNNEKDFLRHVKEAVLVRKSGDFQAMDMYHFDAEELAAADKLASVLSGSESKSILYFEQRKKELPIQSKTELTVSGSDIVTWAGIKGGPWTGEWLSKIESAVINELCSNERAGIKRWFLHEFNREK